MIRTWLASLALAAAAAGAVPADAPVDVYCGSVTCFQIRVPAEGRDAETRANGAMDVINKYLGGKIGIVSTKPAGKNVRVLLNNELVVVVTPADAAAMKVKSAATLAAQWRQRLLAAFDESKAQK
jgi:hypothetical protein